MPLADSRATADQDRSFDNIISSYEELAATALLTLHAEVRCRIIYSLHTAMSSESAPSYLLDQEVSEPDPPILSLNSELVSYDEMIVRFLRGKEVTFVRAGLGLLVNNYLVGNAAMVAPINAKGAGRMQLNILVLQQNLKNIEAGVDLARAANFYALLDKGADAIVEKAKEDASKTPANGGHDANGLDADTFTYEELKTLLELCYSEQAASQERGIENAAKRAMADKLLALSEHMWQS
jgi:exocyst complex component 4